MDGPGARADGASSSEDLSARLFCCRFVRRWIPLAHRQELYHILRITGPLLLFRIMNFLMPFIVSIFCGRLGNSALAGYAMASVTINISTLSTGSGLILACNTLVSQTFGGKNLLQVGVILQRGILILLIFCLPCWTVLLNTQSILLVLGQDPEVARVAQTYVVAFIPAVPVRLYIIQISQKEGVILPQVYMSTVTMVVTLAAHYILLYWLQLGIIGSAAGNSLAHIVNGLLLLAYIRWKKLHVKTWEGWSRDCLQEWGSFMRLAVPSALMMCLEWWVYEFGGFLTGMLSEDDLAAQHVVMMLAFLNYMVPLSIQGAACVRVGNALGAGNTDGAILASRVCLTLTAVLAVFQGLILAAMKSVIGYIFTSDQKIAAMAADIFNVYCFSQFFDALCICMGILVGCGQQKIAAVVNLIGYYCIGLPLSVTLMFVAKLRAVGFWLGLLICVCLQVIFFITVISKLNWKRLTEEAVARARINATVPLMTTESEFGPDHVIQRSNGEGVNSYDGVASQVQDGLMSQQEGGEPRIRLSTSQLIIRRGLVMLAAILILFAGTAVHLLLPLPESSWVTRSNQTQDWQWDWENWTYPTPTVQSTTFLQK
uniref:Multidrug and toxin extrusion protein n=1 Tax=Denticeps clupeoides TaxID=299321 RepID=A0AAY4DRL4_9TELE